jgi:hypothetical protein
MKKIPSRIWETVKVLAGLVFLIVFAYYAFGLANKASSKSSAQNVCPAAAYANNANPSQQDCADADASYRNGN